MKEFALQLSVFPQGVKAVSSFFVCSPYQVDGSRVAEFSTFMERKQP